MRRLNLLLLLLLLLLRHSSASPADVLPYSASPSPFSTTSLVPTPPISLPYHGSPLLSPSPLRIHLLWYGSFSPSQKSILSDFLSSFQTSPPPSPSVSSWWRLLSAYKDARGAVPAATVLPGAQISDEKYSRGKSLKRADVAAIVKAAIAAGKLPPASGAGSSFYLVLTAADVAVERFCMSSCGFHDSYKEGGKEEVAFGWVGNPAVQCPGQCAWPFAVPQYGPPGPPLVAPNGDVGLDGMVISVGSVLAGAATNPFGGGYYQGDPSAPLEAATACAGIYGEGAYPGYPGKLLQNPSTKASFNARGIRSRQFLLPALWSPLSQKCTPP